MTIDINKDEQEILKKIVNYFHETLKPYNEQGQKENEILKSLLDKIS